MADFELYALKLKDLEGGYVDDPDDRGGATNMGITYRTYEHWGAQLFGAGHPSKTFFRAMTWDQAKRIYRAGYWDRCKGDEIQSQAWAEMIIDWYINSGTGAIINLQRALNKSRPSSGLKVDGIIGPITLQAINNWVYFETEALAYEDYRGRRLSFYNDIVHDNPSQQKFLRGWINRVNRFPATLPKVYKLREKPEEVGAEDKARTAEATRAELLIVAALWVLKDIPLKVALVQAKEFREELEKAGLL